MQPCPRGQKLSLSIVLKVYLWLANLLARPWLLLVCDILGQLETAQNQQAERVEMATA